MKLSQTWNLKRFYSSQSLDNSLRATQENVVSLQKELEGMCQMPSMIEKIEHISSHLRQMGSFISCLSAENTLDPRANKWQDRLAAIEAEFETVLNVFDERLLAFSDQDFEDFLELNKERAFRLAEYRYLASKKLSFKEERLINALSIDGYHGWNRLWESLISETPFCYQGENLSLGQIENKVTDQSGEVRKKAFQSIETALKARQNTFAETLNHLGGFRLNIYASRNAYSFFEEALEKSRMQEKTLNAMWEAVENFKPHFLTVLKCKAALLKKDKLSWYDLEAPSPEKVKKISYKEATLFILKHFQTFSPKLASFSRHAFENHWIEAEDRPLKAPGGFCTPLPLAKESRIFMTYGETTSNLFTLAHELGHAFHNHILFDMPEMAQNIPMNLAETASTLAEEIISHAAIAEAKSKLEKRALLDDQLTRSTCYCMNIFARFLFEKDFYTLRKKGYVSAEHLNQLMKESQKRAYSDALEKYHPLFWAGKMHFFFSETPFYNFPYTFGYLLSKAIYGLSKHSDHFEDKYIAFLGDTGQMDVETLAHKHFQVDLTTPEFWQIGLDQIKQTIDDFIALC